MSNVNISTLVSGQLPEFIREDYTTFVAFLEAYYEWLDTYTYDISTLHNIDTTLDSFIQYFKNELALNFPASLSDDRFLLSKMKQIYSAKGTEASYRLLFRLLYDKEIDIKYPSQQMLKVSDGKWIQNKTIFVEVTYGSIDSIVGQTVQVVTNNNKIDVFVDSYRLVQTNVYELFLTNDWTSTFNYGDSVSFKTLFVGVVKPVPSTVSILYAGTGFRVGQIYNIGSNGAKIKITKVTATGGIKSCKIIEYGYGYTADFTTTLLASSLQSQTSSNYFTFNGTTATINDSIPQLDDSGTITRFNYTDATYVDTTYVGEAITTFSDSVVITQSNTQQSDYATISVKLGSLAKYPGYYKNNDGFLDDEMYIQDSKYYQVFSYVVQIDELFDQYKSTLKNLLHPSGMEVFGEYTVNLVHDISLSINIA